MRKDYAAVGAWPVRGFVVSRTKVLALARVVQNAADFFVGPRIPTRVPDGSFSKHAEHLAGHRCLDPADARRERVECTHVHKTRYNHMPDATATTPHARMLFRLLSMAVFLLTVGCASPPTPPKDSGSSVPSSLTAEQLNSITIHALGLVGTPYRYGGNTPEGGFDCSGLIGYVYRNSVGQVPPRTVARLVGFGQPVAMSEIRSGDLVIFGSSRPSHAGIYVGEGRFVHAPSTGGEVRLDRLDGRYWAKLPQQARRP